MTYSERERISHVARRLGFGVEPEILARAASVEDAVAAALDLSRETPRPTDLTPPATPEADRSREAREAAYRYWLTQMVTGPRRIEERLCWFWHDHFATDIRKVKSPYLMLRQHVTIRDHATGSFADLLHAIAVDPAMLVYLDGVENRAGAINENFGREVMELFTLGRGNYTEEDVVAASRAFSGWVVVRPGGRAARLGLAPFTATFLPRRHDDGVKTLLGVTGRLDAAAAIDVILDHPATAEHVATKLFRELTGLDPDPAARIRIAAAFRRDWSIMALVEAIVSEPAFTDDTAIRVKVRTPLERAVGVLQAFGGDTAGSDRPRAFLGRSLHLLGYLPFSPANVAGYPKGRRLLGPFHLVHGFDLLAALPRDLPDLATEELAARLGLFDLDPTTRETLDAAPDPISRAALVLGAPEYFVV